MPQFDTSTFISQVFWLAICLGMVIFCYVRIFIPRFNKTIEKRLSKIHYDINQAKHMQEQAKLLFEENQKKLNDAQHRAEEQIKAALADLELKKKNQLAHIDDELASSLKAMSKSLERQQKALQETMAPHVDECLDKILLHLIGEQAQPEKKKHHAVH
ncbi:MAG: hypothetical protein V4482_00255 [Pseudomonadota bacterium]